MENKKIKLLMQPSDFQGVGSYRNIWPAQSMQKHFSDEIDVEIAEPNFFDLEYYKKFDIIHFHRQLGPYEKTKETCEELRKAGVITIMDIDDYWKPPLTHPLYEIIKSDKLDEKIEGNIKCPDYVTTTTDIFKNYIAKLNPNVHVIPNAVDLSHPMWKSEVQENKSGKCRISWIGGSSHMHDLKLMQDSFNKLNSSTELQDKYQIIICGFDIRGTITEIHPNGERKVRNILPHESIWNQFENIFTSNYSLIKDQEYVKYLKKIKKEDYPNQEMQNFIRRWTLPLTQYAKHYDYCDVCLAPLSEEEYIKDNKGTIMKKINVFNEVKSELKIIESGMKNKVLIAQDFGIYKKLIKNGENGILVSDNKKGWHKAIREVILNPELREKLSTNLHNFVKDKYELKNVTRNRLDFYKKILEDKK